MLMISHHAPSIFHDRYSRSLALAVAAFSLVLVIALSGCGSGAVTSSLSSGSSSGGSSGGSGDSSGGSSGGSSSGTGSTAPDGTAVTISGIMTKSATQTASLHSITPLASSVAAGYKILATDVTTGAGKSASTDSSGKYSLSLVSGDTYVFVIFNGSGRMEAVITGTNEVSVSGMIPQATSYKVVGFMPQGDLETADVTLDGRGNSFWGQKALDSKITITALKANTEYLTVVDKVATGGTTGNFGKVQTPLAAKDKVGGNGLPVAMNPDNNGNGIADALETMTSSTSTALSTRIQTILFSYNLSVRFENTETFLTDRPLDTDGDPFNLSIEVDPVKGQESKILKVEAIPSGLPSYKENIKIYAGSVGFKETVPNDGTLWKDTGSSGYKLFMAEPSPGFQSGTAPSMAWKIYLKPGAGNIKVGDVFILRVTYTDNTFEDFPQMVGYTFASVPELVSYQAGAAAAVTDIQPAAGAKGSRDNPFEIIRGSGSTVDLTLTWAPPTDDRGTALKGNSALQITYDAGGNNRSTEQVNNILAPASGNTSKQISVKTSLNGSSVQKFTILITAGFGGSSTGQQLFFEFQQP